MQNNEQFSRFVVTSVALHLAVVALVFVAPSFFPTMGADVWGSETGREGGVRVSTVPSLPGIELPSPKVVQENVPPSESESLHPAEPAPKSEPKLEAEPEVLIASKTAKPKPPATPSRGATKTDSKAPVSPSVNAVPGTGGQPAVPYGQAGAGTGQTTFSDEAFGVRYGYYVEAMATAIREKWQPGLTQGTARLYVTFTISRKGEVTNFQIAKSSGSPVLDSSAEVAVKSANIPPLPSDYVRPSIDVRFYFENAR